MTLLRVCWVINALTIVLILIAFYDTFLELPAEALANEDVQSFRTGWLAILFFFVAGLLASYILQQRGRVSLAKLVAVLPAGLVVLLVMASLFLVIVFIVGSPSH